MIGMVISLWLLIGLGTCAYMIYKDIQNGVDYTVNDLALAGLCALLGPVTFIMAFFELSGDSVVLKGKGKK